VTQNARKTPLQVKIMQ